jgi:hypothetical protein
MSSLSPVIVQRYREVCEALGVPAIVDRIEDGGDTILLFRIGYLPAHPQITVLSSDDPVDVCSKLRIAIRWYIVSQDARHGLDA